MLKSASQQRCAEVLGKGRKSGIKWVQTPYVWWLDIAFGQERCRFFQNSPGCQRKPWEDTERVTESWSLDPTAMSMEWEILTVFLCQFRVFYGQDPKFGSFGFGNHRAQGWLVIPRHPDSIDSTLVVFWWHRGTNRWKGDEYLWCLGKFRPSHQVINPFHFSVLDLRNWSSWYHGPCNSDWWHLGRGCSGRPGNGDFELWGDVVSSPFSSQMCTNDWPSCLDSEGLSWFFWWSYVLF